MAERTLPKIRLMIGPGTLPSRSPQKASLLLALALQVTREPDAFRPCLINTRAELPTFRSSYPW